MTVTPFCMVYVTVRDRAEAEALARRAVEKRLAACANVFGEIRSFYWWDGRVQNDSECALIFKTRTDLFEALKDEIVATHAYECPCVAALPLIDGSAPYLAWLGEQTSAQPTTAPTPGTAPSPPRTLPVLRDGR